jgi:hypothetical protein
VNRLVALAVIALASPALAETRKPVPGKFERAAGEAFARAVAEEDRGQLGFAIEQYEASLDIAMHPSTVYNLAGVQARHGKLRDAIVSYEMYLALAPNAPDRKQVLDTLAALRARPSTVWIHARNEADPAALDLSVAYILVDGDIISRPGTIKRGGGSKQGIQAKVGFGAHTIDVVTAVTSFHRSVTTTYGDALDVDVYGRPKRESNVVLHAPKFTVAVPGVEINSYGSRFAVPPGRRRVKLQDREFECAPIELDVPSGDSVLYLRVAPTELQTLRYDNPERCRTLSVTKRVLAF